MASRTCSRTALRLLQAIAATGAPVFTADHRHFQRLVAQPLDSARFARGDWTTLADHWAEERATFLARRAPFLLGY